VRHGTLPNNGFPGEKVKRKRPVLNCSNVSWQIVQQTTTKTPSDFVVLKRRCFAKGNSQWIVRTDSKEEQTKTLKQNSLVCEGLDRLCSQLHNDSVLLLPRALASSSSSSFWND
jgi:hypothetical protein